MKRQNNEILSHDITDMYARVCVCVCVKSKKEYTLWDLVKKISIHINMGCTAFLNSLQGKEPMPRRNKNISSHMVFPQVESVAP